MPHSCGSSRVHAAAAHGMLTAGWLALPGPCPQWIFTAAPLAGGKSVVVKNGAPIARFYGLTPSTRYTVTVMGILSDGQQTPADNTLTFSTPSDRHARWLAGWLGLPAQDAAEHCPKQGGLLPWPLLRVTSYPAAAVPRCSRGLSPRPPRLQ